MRICACVRWETQKRALQQHSDMNFSSFFCINKTQHGPDSNNRMAYTFISLWSRMDLSILKAGAIFTADIKTHLKSKLQQWPINLSGAICIIKRRKKVYLFDYAVYQLCMKQLHTTAFGQGWKWKGCILTRTLSTTPFTCPFSGACKHLFGCWFVCALE